jgi:hypothetical protein
MGVISYSLPLWARTACALFCGGVSAALVTVNAQDYASGRAPAGVYLLVIPMVLILMTWAYRLIRLSFRADAAGLVIRNVFCTRRVPVTQITGFDIGTRFVLAPNTVRVITRSGTFPIDVCRRRGNLFIEDLCDIADELDDWLENARAGHP